MTERQFMIICYFLWQICRRVSYCQDTFGEMFEKAERMADRYDD